LPLREPARSQAILAAWAVAAFSLSAVTDLRALAGAAAASFLLFHRGAARRLRRVAVAVLPFTLGTSLASWIWLRLAAPSPPDAAPFVALALRATLVAFVTFSVLDRVDLLRATAPFPSASRLLVLSLAQIHALRLVATDSALALRSRLPRKPGAMDVIRNSGALTVALLTLSARHARDIGDAMRSRGFR
jgi:cobalt/nickel transport system permease protein